MRNEIGESIIYSWLKHIKNCEIIDQNWVISKNWESNWQENKEIISNLNNDSVIPFDGKSMKNIGQSEIDLLGYSFVDKKIFAVESAFHLDGLGYGKKRKNINTVVGKLIRAGLIVNEFFSDCDAEIIFTTPKLTKPQYRDIQGILNEVEKIFRNSGKSCTFRIIGNEEFYSEIMSPLMEMVDNGGLKNDQMDFVRSLQLIELGKKYLIGSKFFSVDKNNKC